MNDMSPNEARLPEDAAVTVTNADTLWAMASPIRMRILGTLRVNGEQTVESISEQLGEAPGAISYHLGQLAHAGLVKKVESPDGDRRKSWWKACQSAIRLGNSEEKNSADESKAMDLFRRSAALSYEMAYERFLDRLPELPREWADSCTSDDHVLNLTAEHGDVLYTIQPGDRIAQLMVLPILRPTLTVVEELDETERGSGGFGSTGR